MIVTPVFKGLRFNSRRTCSKANPEGESARWAAAARSAPRKRTIDLASPLPESPVSPLHPAPERRISLGGYPLVPDATRCPRSETLIRRESRTIARQIAGLQSVAPRVRIKSACSTRCSTRFSKVVYIRNARFPGKHLPPPPSPPLPPPASPLSLAVGFPLGDGRSARGEKFSLLPSNAGAFSKIDNRSSGVENWKFRRKLKFQAEIFKVT